MAPPHPAEAAAHESGTEASTIDRMTGSWLIPAAHAAELIRESLEQGKTGSAVRTLTEAVARLIASDGKDIPEEVLAAPGATGDLKFDTVLATAFLYAVNLCGVVALPWMRCEPLAEIYLWGGDGGESLEYRRFIQRSTPKEFLANNILCRPRDWVNA